VTFQQLASVALAEMDLKLVQSVINAIRTADIESGAARKAPLPVLPPSAQVTRSEECRDHCCDSEHRPHNDRHSTRPIYPIYTRFAPAPAAPLPTETVVTVKVTDDYGTPLPPPWKTVPWKEPPHLRPQIKLIVFKPVKREKGSIVDCFI
jgi:hypothetical protein